MKSAMWEDDEWLVRDFYILCGDNEFRSEYECSFSFKYISEIFLKWI